MIYKTFCCSRECSWHHETRCIYTIPWQDNGIGICLYIGETNVVVSQMLYESKCHQLCFLSSSDTSTCHNTLLGSIDVFYQALEAHKNWWEVEEYKNMKQGNSNLQCFSLMHTPGCLWESCHPYLWPSIVPECTCLVSFTNVRFGTFGIFDRSHH